jgi:NAD(P)-dependent dehydrogenase (short-subunit alcohol dehydrogenase family)
MTDYTDLAIVTGASRGLGHALAAALQKPGARLLTMARRGSDLPPMPQCAHEHWQVDLADTQVLAERLAAWLQALRGAPLRSTVFIHNAAALSTPAPLPDVPLPELAQAVRVNLEAPLLLSAAFLRATAHWPGRRKLLFISSGLGRSAMAGAASYCATKAGLDHLARVLALEEAERPNGARVSSLAPGVIDTDMQVQLRGADAAAFAARQRFLDLQQGGQLLGPGDAARRVLAVLARDDFGAKPVSDVRDA